MKRFYQVIAVAVIALAAPVAVSTPASAAFTCKVGFTGPDSNNMCTSSEKYECSVTNTNKVTITNTSTQEAVSGTVVSSGNTSGCNATSGTVSNTDGTTFNVTITNGDSSTEQPSTCLASAVIPATEEPEKEQPAPQPGSGGASTPVKPAQAAKPASLPVTSAGKAPVIALLGSAFLTVALAAAYRRLLP